MKNISYIIIIFLSVANCTLNKVIDKHGIRNLEKKQKLLEINISNINDISSLLGPPSTTSSFDNDLWIYIEREKEKKKIYSIKKNTLITNNVLLLEINKRGLLVKKEFLDINNMNELEFSKTETINNFSKKSFVYNFLSSMRQKINDPLGKRKKPTQQ